MGIYKGNLDDVYEKKTLCKIDTTNRDSYFISICVPTYNRLTTLIKTINSIYENTLNDKIEVIICDNSCDTDNSSTYIFLKNGNFKELRYYLNSENLGMTGNWNKLIQLARGKYVSFLHDDDLISEYYVTAICELINKAEKESHDNVGFIKSSFVFFEDDNSIQRLDKEDDYKVRKITMTDSLIKGIGPTTTPSCGMVFNKAALTKIGGFSERYYPCADHIVGFVLQQIGYSGYETINSLGYYRWSVNDTLRPKTQIETCKKNDEIREYFYRSSNVSRLFGFLFKNSQYSDDVNGIIKSCSTYGICINKSELVFRNGYKEKSVLLLIYKLIKKADKFSQIIRKKI